MTEAGGVADDEGGSFFGELFLNQVYRVEERTWTHPETNVARTLRMHVSGAACTDYDLTGAHLFLLGCAPPALDLCTRLWRRLTTRRRRLGPTKFCPPPPELCRADSVAWG